MRVRRGFTLTEVLVVLVIIAVLAAILFPVSARAKAAANATACQSNMRQIAMASLQYAADNNEILPFGTFGGNDWLHKIGLTRLKNRMQEPVLRCPDLVFPDDGSHQFLSGYGYNACTVNRAPPEPSRTVMIGDVAIYHSLGNPPVSIGSDFLDMPDSFWADKRPWILDTFGSVYAPHGQWGSLRHSDHGNYVFHDGSAKRLAPAAFRVPASGHPCGAKPDSWIGPSGGYLFNPREGQ